MAATTCSVFRQAGVIYEYPTIGEEITMDWLADKLGSVK
jgi:hypothetical protein